MLLLEMLRKNAILKKNCPTSTRPDKMRTARPELVLHVTFSVAPNGGLLTLRRWHLPELHLIHASLLLL
jgi:hypothetical protein